MSLSIYNAVCRRVFHFDFVKGATNEFQVFSGQVVYEFAEGDDRVVAEILKLYV